MTFFQQFVRSSIVILVFLLQGCGREGPPQPPEVFSPSSVEYLEATASLEGVQFSWTAPGDDLRGNELESLDGYWILRKLLEKESDLTLREEDFEIIAKIEDPHVEKRERLREEARAAGKPSHRVKVPQEEKEFAYLDTGLESGRSYLYKIVPVNQGGVKGEVTQIVQVFFRGNTSEVQILDQQTFQDALEQGVVG